MKQYLEKRGIYITWSQLVMRIIFDLVGFLLALLPAGLTLYLTDVWITSGTHMPTSWILGIIVCVFLIHFYCSSLPAIASFTMVFALSLSGEITTKM